MGGMPGHSPERVILQRVCLMFDWPLSYNLLPSNLKEGQKE